MIEKRLERLWQNLQGKKPHMPHFVSEIRLHGIRGFDDVRVVFDYPVSVVAGGNASGKSTVLTAAACGYTVPGAGVRDFVPSTLFPDYRPRAGGRGDRRGEVVIDFHYSTPDGRQSMRWRRSKGWNRSYFGRKNARQPRRNVYLRTISNLANPSEVRGILSMSRLDAPPKEERLTASQIAFARRLLPFRYEEVVSLISGKKDLLFASRESGVEYSELHMAAGERAVLRLARELAQLEDALVLLDEVEAGLHPWVQQLLMLELQQLALRNNLQVIVTTHSPVVLDSVPTNARIFLERTEHGRVAVLRQPYRDVIQDALYGRTHDVVNLLCEDDVAEGILRGVLDVVIFQQRLKASSVRIGRDTGVNEFPMHAKAFRKFGQIHNFIFVLDGDQRDGDVRRRIRGEAGSDVPVLFLPGRSAPEVWMWESLRSEGEVAEDLGTEPHALAEVMSRLDSIYDSASDTGSEIAKQKLFELGEELVWGVPDICRIVARKECSRKGSDIQPLVEDLTDALFRWRSA